jgi:DNA-binding MarR family transcriptional regulator
MSSAAKSDIPIEKLTSRNLKRAYNIMHVGSNRLFKNLEITVAQFDLMETILMSENRALTIQDLASKTVSLQPNITRMVAELESAGLVERSSGSDRRIVIVQLTPEGTEIVKKIRKPLMDLHINQYKNLSKEELNQLNELLIKISVTPDNQ